MKTLHRDLRRRLEDFDGKAVTILGEIEHAFIDAPSYMQTLLTLVADQTPHIGNGATWLIKSALEKGHGLTASQALDVCGQIPSLTDWMALLHICQSIRFMSIPPDHASSIMAHLRPLTAHKRPFLRAWALDAIVHIAARHPEHAEDARLHLKAGLEDTAASVRARARQLASHLAP